MRVKASIATDFIKLQNDLPRILEMYNISVLWLSKKSGIHEATIRRKLKDKSFKGEELQKLIEVINA
jgi:predicted transcriptional regulator